MYKMKQYRLDQLFKAVSDPTRLRLLNLLRLGSICVCELHAVLRIPQPTASRHLAALRHAGLVEDCRSGSRIIYSLVPPGTPQIDALFELMDKCRPQDELMKEDLVRLKEAVRNRSCRLDPYPPEREYPALGNASLAEGTY
jgi:ArsR family transcriptional regulator, arsenate/arsenite/antimonite-responsive transcriptional repressor